MQEVGSSIISTLSQRSLGQVTTRHCSARLEDLEKLKEQWWGEKENVKNFYFHGIRHQGLP